MFNSLRFLLVSIISLLLVACSGSSSSDQPVGVLSDAGTVSGVQYRTATQSGTTDSGGKFLYNPGETVTFFIGNIVIGQALASPALNTFDLVGISPPLSGLGIPNKTPQSLLFQKAINISTLLQTLDDDANPANGISIPKEAASIASTATINFSQSSIDFQDTFALRQFISRCRTAGLWGG